jgi:hypothetical protein
LSAQRHQPVGNTRAYRHSRRFLFVLLWLCSAAAVLPAPFTATTPTPSWTVVPYIDPTKADPNQDQQTGQGEGDIVGGGYLPSIYMHYEGTAGSTTGMLYFRMRLGEEENPPGFSRAAFIFIDANGDGKMDMMLGVDNSGGGATKIGIWDPGTGTNSSPSTTSVVSPPAVTYVGGATNYDWSSVTTTIDPTAIAANVPVGVNPLNTDGRTGSGDHTDRFLTFAINFADLCTRLAAKGITINSSSPLRIVVESATQDNSLNQDIGGVDDQSAGFSPSLTWEALGALTPPIIFGNVAPVNSVPATASVAKNGTLLFSGAQLVSASDANFNLSTVRVTSVNGNITVTQVGASGQASITSGANNSTTLTLSGTQAQINAALATLTFQPVSNYTGAASVQILSTDQGLLTDSDTIAIIAGNSPPINTTPGTQAATEDVVLSVGGLSVSDFDGNLSTLRLTVTSGAISISLAGGATISSGANGSSTLTLSGTQAQINAALTTLSYLGNLNFNGTDSLAILSTDSASATASSTVQINFAAVNDPPIASNDSAATPEDTAVTITVLGNDSDVDGDTLSVTGTTVPAAQGVVVVNANGTLTFTPATNFYGPATISYSISDGQGGAASAVVLVTVAPANDAPVALNDSATTPEDTAVTIIVLGNDSDVDGDTLSVSGATVPPAQGAAVVNANGTLTFTPATNFNGPASISYSISDGQGGTASAALLVTVFAANDAPVALNDSATTPKETAVTITVLGNDSDVDGDSLSVTGATVAAAQGAVVVNANGTLTFTPATNFSGPTSISYSISDGQGGTASAVVVVTVVAANDAPVALDDSVTTPEDAAVTINVLGNDSDTDGDPLSVTGATVPASQGTVIVNANGSLTFTPATNFNGPASISYSISDGQGGTASANVQVTVVAVNDAPVALDDSSTTPEDTAVIISVLGNDSDVDGDTLSVSSATVPAVQGAAVVNANGTLTFTPASNFNGPASISYSISDGQGGTASAVVLVTVVAVNDAPLAVNDSATTPEDTAVIINVLNNDSDVDGDTLSVTGATVTAVQGTAVVNANGTITFTPAADFNGAAVISYSISDGNGGSASAAINVDITPANDMPVALDDAATTAEDTPVTIPILANDSDVDGDTLTVTTATVPPAQGNCVINANGTLTFTPAANYNNAASISYSISDGKGGSASATVTVTITAVNDDPVAGADVANATANLPVTVAVIANDSDPDSDTLTVTDATVPGTQGTVVINANNTVTFTPAAAFTGTAVITYTISDGHGGTASTTVTVTVSTAPNTPPVAVNDTAATTESVAVNIAVLANDTDADNDTLAVTDASVPAAQGSVAVNANGTLTFTPAASFIGTASIAYTISDGRGGSASATATVNVTAPPNGAPVATNDTFNLPGTSLAVLANDSDPEGQPLTISDFTQGAHGTVVLNANNSFTYTAGTGFLNSDTFTYTISDEADSSATATVTIINQAPVAQPDTQFVIPATPVEISVLANDLDPNGDTLAVSSVTQGAHGTVTITGNGTTVTYVPGAGFSGSDTFITTITDGHGGTASAKVTLTSAFASGAGKYDGLLVHPQSSGPNGGYIMVKTSRTGLFTGTLYHAGHKMRIRGGFDANGDFATTVLRYDGVLLDVTMHFEVTGPRIVGEVSDGNNTSAIRAEFFPYRRTHPAPRTGRYSILLPPSEVRGTPTAVGYAVMQIQINGVVSIVGRTGDGTPFTSSTLLNADGETFELYSGMYLKKQRGSIYGTIRFVETPEVADFNGPLVWHKPPQTQSHAIQYHYYTVGFQTRIEAIGCKYVSVSGTPALNLALTAPNTSIELSGAMLAAPVVETLTFSPENVFTVQGANPRQMTLKFNPVTGAIRGRFLKENGQRTDIFATIFQKQNLGAGYFFNTHEIGTATINP